MTILELWEDFKAWRRGEHRVAPYGTKGRVYARANGETLGKLEAKARFIGKIEKMRYYSAQEDAWYLVDPVTGERTREVKE